jgi:hypothetical protein
MNDMFDEIRAVLCVSVMVASIFFMLPIAFTAGVTVSQKMGIIECVSK